MKSKTPKIVCPKCENDNYIENDACPHCGFTQKEPDAAGPEENPETNVVDIGEAKTRKVDIITNTKEEKQMLERVHQITKSIAYLESDNINLEVKASNFEHLAQTLKFEPFTDLKKTCQRSFAHNCK